MAERIRTVCNLGQLIITEDAIIVERGTKRIQIARSSLTAIESKQTSPKFLWSPGTTKFIFHSGVEHLEIGMIRTPIAQEILAELNRRQ